MSIPVEDDAESGPFVKVTISVGVAALDGASCELTGSLTAATPPYTKDTGRNTVHVTTALPA
jgi:hypothetical protein